MNVKKGDNILIISGKDKGKTGKITRSFPKDLKVLVEGINLKKKHIRPKKQGEKGQVVAIPAPVNISNMKIICPKCGKATRVGHRIEKGASAESGQIKRFRICKKCGQDI